MKKVIVTTTINPPTKAIHKFEAMEDWELVVIGDLKTPKDYRLARGRYLDPAAQESYDKGLSDAIGWNCIQRRNFGLLVAHDMKADVVAVVDDDNIPLPGWGRDLMVGREVEVNYYETDLPAFDPVGATNHPALWHRGFPLQLLPKRDYARKSRKRVKVDVQADFWNGDPDIDAFCRMEHAPECDFDPRAFPIASNKLSPFNSQNTFLAGAMLKDYFLYPHVGRMDDIWAAYYVEAKGYRVAYGKASVFQDRNVHNLVRDMQQEYLGYENNLAIVEALPKDADALLAYLPGRSVWALELYKRHFARG
ncbi:MAG TPA: hypothetical protein VMF53_01255 [Alphaproteobacteria bacterium]|nr:hypothetical protein [Alphaproteobacteria bacterium]